MRLAEEEADVVAKEHERAWRRAATEAATAIVVELAMQARAEGAIRHDTTGRHTTHGKKLSPPKKKNSRNI